MVGKWGASATLALVALGLAGCGRAAPHPHQTARCATVSAPHVTVVVEVSTHRVLDRCVVVARTGASGEAVMRRSGVEIALQHFSFGDAVCQLDRVPPAYTHCFSTGRPYWALFVAPAHGLFRAASTGIQAVHLEAGEALGWRYVPAKGRAAPPPLPRVR
ncbi:MAG TPA: hypothetical protein VNN74_07755 [Candidatus Micrarchaeia archaeon]|nr:hypothetical protein [Candidatus Micrarchaeia archaeon]